MDEILEIIDLVYSVLDKIDVRGLKDRKAVVLAQENLIVAYHKLSKEDKNGVGNDNDYGGSEQSDSGEDLRGDEGFVR